jgi:2-(1,2-epoxy-1,2-dihydrophenyl)acetyl-CoA isomerase
LELIVAPDHHGYQRACGGTWLLPRVVGMKRALALMLTGDQIPAEEAARSGIVYKIFDDASFMSDTMALAARLAAGPVAVFRMIKQAAHASDGNDLTAQLALERDLQCEAGRGLDFIEGVTAFREKRAPKFEGR